MNGDNNQTLDPLDDLINSLGGPANADPDNSGDDGDGNGTAAGNEPAATTEPAGDGAQEPDTEPTGDPDGDNNGDGTQEPAGNSQEPGYSAQDKQARAFAQMRIQNSQMKQTLQSLAQLVGLDANNLDGVSKAVQDKLLQNQAKQQNLPPEVLGRLQALERQNNEREAYLGFQKVKDSFNLTDAELSEFADSLIANGLNPFAQHVDLYNEYIVNNYDKLIEKAKQDGIREEAERAAKAAKQSTVPGNKSGKDKGLPDKINTMQDLDKFLSEA